MAPALVEHTNKTEPNAADPVEAENPSAVFALTIYVLVKFIHYPYLDLVATENIPSLSYT